MCVLVQFIFYTDIVCLSTVNSIIFTLQFKNCVIKNVINYGHHSDNIRFGFTVTELYKEVRPQYVIFAAVFNQGALKHTKQEHHLTIAYEDSNFRDSFESSVNIGEIKRQ